MTLFTTTGFAQLAKNKAGNRNFHQFVNEVRTLSRPTTETSIFLSHSHVDRSFVDLTITFFRTLGVNVYVDWMDSALSDRTSVATADTIKAKIRDNDKFILLATNSAIASKWCNWELGIGDIYKLSTGKICLLPLAENNGHWEGNEYLGLYPRIEPLFKDGNSYYDDLFKVVCPNRDQILLDNWLKK